MKVFIGHILVLITLSHSIWASVVYVDATAQGMNNGSSWSNAYTNLEIAVSSSADSVFVAQGTYKPSSYISSCDNCTARDVTFFITGKRLFGGFPTGGSNFANRDFVNNPTILSGDIGVIGDNTDNAYHVVMSFTNINGTIPELNGFIVKEGNANANSYSSYMKIQQIQRFMGGGAYFYGKGKVLNNVFLENGGSGLALDYWDEEYVVRNNVLAYNDGTGINIYMNAGQRVVFENNVVCYNLKGGVRTNLASVSARNNTIVNNSCSDTFGAGLYVIYGALDSLINNIFWDNERNGSSTMAGDDCLYDFTSGSSVAMNCLLQVPGNNAVNYPSMTFPITNPSIYGQNPIFVDINDPDGPDNKYFTNDDGLRLQNNSPCIDFGSSLGTSFDILGQPRIGNSDMGAYEGLSTNMENTLAENISIYPNPNRGIFTFDWKGVPISGTLLIYNVIGNKVWEEVLIDFSGAKEIDVQDLPRGVYYVSIPQKNDNFVRKLITE